MKFDRKTYILSVQKIPLVFLRLLGLIRLLENRPRLTTRRIYPRTPTQEHLPVLPRCKFVFPFRFGLGQIIFRTGFCSQTVRNIGFLLLHVYSARP